MAVVRLESIMRLPPEVRARIGFDHERGQAGIHPPAPGLIEPAEPGIRFSRVEIVVQK
jgi:hypothetical protein